MQIQDALSIGSEFLRDLTERQILISHVLKIRREEVIAHPEKKMSAAHGRRFLELCKKRKKGVPMAYLTHHKEFYGLDFYVDEWVLIPRPETEMVVESAITCAKKLVADVKKSIKILDVGTGSGCIAIALAKSLERIGITPQITASDISNDALVVARKNIKMHKLSRTVKLQKGDLLTNFLPSKFDVIVANLPYIPKKEARFVESDVKKYEPKIALWGGNDGLKLLYKFLVQISKMKRTPAYVIGEFGFSMKKNVSHLIKKILPNASVAFKKDLAGLDRMFILSFVCGKN